MRAWIGVCLLAAACGTTGRDVKEGPSGFGLPEARVRLEDGDLAGAMTLTAKYTSEHPDDARGFYTLGTLLSMTGEWADARIAFERCVSLDGYNGAAWNNLGLVDMALHETERSLERFRRAADAMPADALPLRNFATAATRLGHFQDAVEALEDAAARAPGDRKVQLELAYAYARASKRDEAGAAFSELLRTNESDAAAHAGLANVLRQKGDLEGALPHADRAVGLAPGDPVVLLVGALVHDFKDDAAGAEALYKRAVEAGPTNLDVLYNYGMFLEQKQRPTEAVAQYRRYAELAGPDEAALQDVKKRIERLAAAPPPPKEN